MTDEKKPKDRNEAVRAQLLKKRTEEAKKRQPLSPGEMVDDAFARGVDGGLKWVRSNVGKVAGIVGVLILGGVGYLVYEMRATKEAQAASSELGRAVLNERGYISETPSDGDADDPTPTFASREERAQAALSAYRGVATKYKGSGAGMLARLGEGGVLLDEKDWDGALAAYREAKDSPLGAADLDVRARALEGIGFALEGKGDIDGAIKSFRELENTDVRGFKELGMYHQARLYVVKGDEEKAKELAKATRERLQRPSETRPFVYLNVAVDDLLRQIDPASVPEQAGVGGRPLSSEDIRRLQEEFQRRVQEAQEAAAGSEAPEEGAEAEGDEPAEEEREEPSPNPETP